MLIGCKCAVLPELVEQLGVLRYGHRARVGDKWRWLHSF
jgi:hypothetical protein